MHAVVVVGGIQALLLIRLPATIHSSVSLRCSLPLVGTVIEKMVSLANLANLANSERCPVSSVSLVCLASKVLSESALLGAQ